MARAETGMQETRDPTGWLWWVAGVAALFLWWMFETIGETTTPGRPGLSWLVSLVVVIALAAVVLPSIAIFVLASE